LWEARLVFLDRAREWQANAAAFGVLPKVSQDLPIEGDARFLCPPFHLDVIIL
jgi:hypothetical protein